MKKINIQNFNLNAFNLFRDWALVTPSVGNTHNSMTIGWGGLGVLYRKDVAMVYIRENRYSFNFFEKCECFTISLYNKEYMDALTIYGTKSGKDTDKDALTHFTPITIDNAVSYKEAKIIIVCKKIYQAKLEDDLFTSDVAKCFYEVNDDGTRHHMYIGEIVAIYEN